MDSKRDLDGEKRLIRNEKARRRRALQYACRYLPIELEKKIFNHMRNPNNGRIDVSMKWQKHPVAKIISDYIAVFNDIKAISDARRINICITNICITSFSDIIVSEVTLACNHGMRYHVSDIFLRELSMFLKENFQLRFKRNIAFRCIPIMKRALEKEVKDAHPHSQFVNQLTATYKTFFRNLATQFGRDYVLNKYGQRICLSSAH
jgi:hypothetical protein